MDILEEWKNAIEQPRTTYLDPPVGHDMAVRTIAEIERLRKQVEAMQWKPISEAPKEELVDSVLFNGDDVKAGQYWEGHWVDSFCDYLDPQPTHYMPLPPAPEE